MAALACVHCGDPHAAADCPHPLAQSATCINCKGPHPANQPITVRAPCPIQREARNKKTSTVARKSHTPAELQNSYSRVACRCMIS
ncbi:hypothetical protein evm_004570 [Chilo suppressalis]|nr:hypothetical protein evm_004570 [Chilo suppressalis]